MSADILSSHAVDEKNRERTIIKTSIIGIMANVFLAAFKAVVGLLSHSIAIILDSVNNLSDAGSSLITIIGTKLAKKQPDRKHPWGHGRAEYLSSMIISVIILYAGITSLVESVKKVIAPETPDYSTAAIIIVSVAVVVKILLGTFVKRTGKRVNSDSLVNSGTDALMDSIISASTLAAAIIFLVWHISLEAWLGAVISVVIVKSGIEMLRETISHLLGQRVSVETARKVRECIMSFPQVHGVYDLIFHDYGPEKFNCSGHIEVPDTLSAREIDQLQRQIAIELYVRHGIILTALSVYTFSVTDDRDKAVRSEIYSIAMSVEHVLEAHGFYLDEEQKRIQFDIIVSFDAPDRDAVYNDVVNRVREKYPEYELYCTLDTDFSLSEQEE
ncbi:cation diffusion facilitator family transporter [Ruminococcus sp. YRD2003]|uniref:cation diffusion facilitator family transporter n=1 Tax=Ruminococcus sp. YRD2003 TaxID=1452313 RepID=UPI0008C097B7|nr:cation diffusion facilitator family transporter [Ruminococcus flavefaciens]